MTLRNPRPVFERMVEEVDHAVAVVARFGAGLDRVVGSGDAVIREDAVAPVDERTAGNGVLIAVGLIAERVVRRLVVSVERQRAEALIAEGSLDLGAAVERADRGRVEDE